MAYYFSIRFAEIMSIHQGSSPSNKLVSQFIVKIFSQATSEAQNEKKCSQRGTGTTYHQHMKL